MIDNCCCMTAEDCDEHYEYEAIEIAAPTDVRCSDCGALIKAGETCTQHGWLYEDPDEVPEAKRDYLYTCKLCDVIFETLCDCNKGRIIGYLWDHLQECIGIGSPDEIPEWTEDDEEAEPDRIEFYRRENKCLN